MGACYGGTDVMERSCAVARGIDINNCCVLGVGPPRHSDSSPMARSDPPLSPPVSLVCWCLLGPYVPSNPPGPGSRVPLPASDPPVCVCPPAPLVPGAGVFWILTKVPLQ
jgi:hypothetical protein